MPLPLDTVTEAEKQIEIVVGNLYIRLPETIFRGLALFFRKEIQL